MNTGNAALHSYASIPIVHIKPTLTKCYEYFPEPKPTPNIINWNTRTVTLLNKKKSFHFTAEADNASQWRENCASRRHSNLSRQDKMAVPQHGGCCLIKNMSVVMLSRKPDVLQYK